MLRVIMRDLYLLTHPEFFALLKGELIDTKDNRLLWRYATDVVLPTEGKWDEPPNYPDFDNQLKKAVSTAQKELLLAFFQHNLREQVLPPFISENIKMILKVEKSKY